MVCADESAQRRALQATHSALGVTLQRRRDVATLGLFPETSWRTPSTGYFWRSRSHTLLRNRSSITSCYSTGSLRPHRCSQPTLQITLSLSSKIVEGKRKCTQIYPPKSAPSREVSGPPPNTWFLGPTRVHVPIATSIGSSVL